MNIRRMNNLTAEEMNKTMETGPKPHSPVVRLYPDNSLVMESALYDGDDDLINEWDWEDVEIWSNGLSFDESIMTSLRNDIAESTTYE
jgi:hypothetical protein